MNDWFEFIEQDALAIFNELSWKDFHIPFSFLLWLLIVSMKLKGIDQRDHIAGMSYTSFCTAIAILLFLALPQYFQDIKDIGFHLAFVGFFVAITSYRWFHSNDQVIVVQAKDKKNTLKGEADHEKARF